VPGSGGGGGGGVSDVVEESDDGAELPIFVFCVNVKDQAQIGSDDGLVLTSCVASRLTIESGEQ